MSEGCGGEGRVAAKERRELEKGGKGGGEGAWDGGKGSKGGWIRGVTDSMNNDYRGITGLRIG